MNIKPVGSLSTLVLALTCWTTSTCIPVRAADAAAATSGSATSSETSDSLQEIVVTAERHREDLQKTALSISVVTGEQLASTGITSYADAIQNVPAVQFEVASLNVTPGAPTFAIRGLGTDATQSQPSVTTFLDGVIQGGEGANFYDIDRIEVMRGPQGTLYGGNAPAGNVNIISNSPSFNGFSGSALIDVGNYGAVHTTGVANIPLTDALAVRVAANEVDRDNYASSSAPGSKETSERAKILYQLNADLSILVGTEQYQYSGLAVDGYQAMDLSGNLIGPYTPNVGWGSLDTQKYYSTITWNLGIGTLTYIPAYQYLTQQFEQATTLPENGINYIREVPTQETRTQDLRMTSNPGSEVTWVVGLYYDSFFNDSTLYVGKPSATAALPPVTSTIVAKPSTGDDQRSTAGYGQITVPIVSGLRVTGGLRYSSTDVYCPDCYVYIVGPHKTIPSDFNQTFDNVSYLGRVEADVAAKSMVYASVGTGFRPGGAGAQGQNFAAETATNYEIGSKNRFLDDRLQLNADVYYTNYPEYQNESDSQLTNGTVLASIVSIPARFEGIELESAAQLTHSDKLTLSAAYEHARYTGDSTIGPANPLYGTLAAAGVTLPTDGQALPHAPDWNVSAAYEHTWLLANDGYLLGNLNGRYLSSQSVYFGSCLYDPTLCTAGNSPAQFIQHPYTLADVAFGYHSPGDKYTFTAYCRNLTDEQYKTGILDAPDVAVLGAPRTYGFIVAAKW